MGRGNAASEIQVAHSWWKAFWGLRTHREKYCCYWSLDLTEVPPPTLDTPWYQLKWLPQLQGTELAWAETNPTQHNWFMMASGEHSQTDPCAEEICWHTQLLPLHCLKNATRLCLWVPSQTQQPPAQSGWHWVDAKMRSGCWATEQMLWLLL